MKAEDLMIGDWVDVYCDDSLENGFYRSVQICGVHGNKICFVDESDCQWINIEDAKIIKPIVLTEEILEKNNFHSIEDFYNHRKFFFLGKNEYDLDVYLDNKSIILVEADYDTTVYTYMCDCEYVHQFQHILKDLKINREIKL